MKIAHQPGSEPLTIPEQIPNPAVQPVPPPRPEREPERKEPVKVPEKEPANRIVVGPGTKPPFVGHLARGLPFVSWYDRKIRSNPFVIKMSQNRIAVANVRSVRCRGSCSGVSVR